MMRNQSKVSLFKARTMIPFLLIALLFSGCGKNIESPGTQQQSTEGQDQKDKIPDQLKSIEQSIEKIVQSLEGPAITDDEEESKPVSNNKEDEKDKESQDKEKKEGEGQEKESEGGSGQEEGKDSKEEEKQGSTQAESDKAQNKPKNPWEKIEPVINSLHYEWNSYMPMATKQGAAQELSDNFSTALNQLTDSIKSKKKENTLLASSNAYKYIPDFYSLYKTGISPEIKRIRYYTRNAMLQGMAGNWDKADQDIEKLKSSWNIYKDILPKEQQETSSKLGFSIYELEKVVREKNQPLVDIKSRVTMSNIKSLEKALEESSGQGG